MPRDAKGIKIVKMLHVFGYDDAPHGHAEVVYDNVRVPKNSILLGEGRGFEIAQGRLGPGRIHHCMRAIGVAERALEMAIKRAKSRVAFGQRISEMGVTKAHVADMRMEIDMARLLVLKAAWAMDKFGNKEARQQIAMIKVAVPNITSKVVDRCLQLHGAGGVSQVFKLASMYAHQRTLAPGRRPGRGPSRPGGPAGDRQVQLGKTDCARGAGQTQRPPKGGLCRSSCRSPPGRATPVARHESSGPRALVLTKPRIPSLMMMSEPDARGPQEHEKTRHWSGAPPQRRH